MTKRFTGRNAAKKTAVLIGDRQARYVAPTRSPSAKIAAARPAQTIARKSSAARLIATNMNSVRTVKRRGGVSVPSPTIRAPFLPSVRGQISWQTLAEFYAAPGPNDRGGSRGLRQFVRGNESRADTWEKVPNGS